MNRKKMKYFIFICSIITFLTLLVVIYDYRSYMEHTYSLVHKDLENEAKNNAVFIENIMDINMTIIEDIGEVLSGVDLNNGRAINSEIIPVFKRIQERVPIMTSIYFFNEKDGSGIQSEGYRNSDDYSVDRRIRMWYQKALASEKPVVTPVYMDIKTKKPTITISYAIRKDGEVKGVVGVDYFLEDMYKILKNVDDSDTDVVSTYIFDAEGNIIIHPIEELLGFSFAHPQEEYFEYLKKSPMEIKDNYNRLWNENISRNDEGELVNSGIAGSNVHGYFTKINKFDWIVVSHINDEVVYKEIYFRLFKALVIAIIFLIFVGIVLYFALVNLDIKDELTGVYKKNKLYEILDRKARMGERKIILFIDIYNFSLLNSSFGIKWGDRLLKEFSIILSRYFGQEGILVHSKADEFFFLFDSIDWEYAEKKCEAFLKELEKITIPKEKMDLNIEVFLGLTKLSPDHMKDPETAVLLIEDIFTKLKKGNEREFLIFPEFQALLNMKKETDTKKVEILKAISQNKIVPFFQPIYNLKEQRIEKYEVLMRIKEEDKYLSPFPYIQAAEETHMIEKIDLIVLEKAFKYKREVDKEDNIIFSVNVSGQELDDAQYLNKIVKMLDKYNIKYKNIIFEITETQNIKDLDRLVHMIGWFKKMGFRFSIDDFGTGFASIQYLKSIPVDFVKIDGSFIKEIEIEENWYLVKSIVSMAKAFKLLTIAEFVENEKIIDKLKEVDIDFAQGYYVGKPQADFV